MWYVYACLFVCGCVYVCLCGCIYIYIYRERERYVCMYVYSYFNKLVDLFVDIYINTHTRCI